MTASVVYDQAFFDLIRPGVQRSADALVPWLLDRFARAGFRPKSMVDVGCGEGWWAAEFHKYGVEGYGIDGDEGGSALIGGIGGYYTMDLTRDVTPFGRFDLALSLEVAEHLPPERAESFVNDLCHLAPVVVFSAAIPGQGGHGHLNEAWPAYWGELFDRVGYKVTGDLRYDLWADDRIELWYRQNLLVAWAPGACDLEPAWPLPLVHPNLWQAYGFKVREIRF